MSVEVSVFLDDGSGTFPVDISSRVRLSEGVSVSGYGRGDEFSQPGAASLSLTLDNADGFLTGGGVGWDMGGWDEGPWDDSVTLEPGTGIRYAETIGATTKNVFTGFVESLNLGWPGGGEEFSTVAVSATDRLADLGRRTLGSMLEQEILLDNPTAYYTLGEAEGSTSAGDTSGNQAPTLAPAGSGASVTFGAIGTPNTSLRLAGGQYLAPAAQAPSSVLTLGCFFAGTSAPPGPSDTYIILAADVAFIRLRSDGSVDFVDVIGTGVPVTSVGPVVNDGLQHNAWMTFDGVNGQAYVDGIEVATWPSAAAPSFLAGIGGVSQAVTDPLALFGYTSFDGTLGHVVTLDTTLSAGEIADIYAASRGDFQETTDARLSRIASYAGLTPTFADPSGQEMGAQATSGQSLFQAMQDVAQAEAGVLFVNGDGDLVMQGRGYRAMKTTADLTLGEQEAASDTTVTWDTQQLVNQVTVTRTGGAEQVVSDGTPTALYPASLEVNVTRDEDALAQGQWLLNKHQTTAPRLASATFDLLASPDAEDLLALEIGDRLSLSDMPSQLWADAGDYTVEGWSKTTSLDTATLTVNLLPWDLNEAMLWDSGLWDEDVWAI